MGAGHQRPARCRSFCYGGKNRTGVGTEAISCLKASKQLLRRQVRPRVEHATQDEMAEFSERVRSADAREALTAFFEKGPPRFNSREPR